ncbi:MAG: hypothetical protein B6229_06015 [Spirochaetaceae bacterium 4572_7]|nr:MAG: hypothetical protein B6229_06015 [Spirochaetaceae bacterium 4572_7]
MKNKKEFDKSILILLAILIITLITAFSLYLNVRVDKISQVIKDSGVIKILLTVVDDDNKPFLTQVVLINTETDKGALIDIPENTGTILSSTNRYSRIDNIYEQYGIDTFREKIGEILSVDILYHMAFTKKNFSEVIDFIDGLDIFVSKSLDSSDSDSLIPSGSVVLEGDKVIQYLKLNDSEEYSAEDVSRKQKIIQGFLSQLKKYSTKISTEKNINFITNRMTTNLDLNSSMRLFKYLGELESNRLVLQGVLGDKKIVSGEELIFPYNNESLIKIRIKRILINLNNPEIISDEKLNFSIQILNGTDRPGLASRTATYFRSFAYSISGVGNADRGAEEHEFTTILVRKGNNEAAERIGELINCKSIHSLVEEGIDDTIDFTIILGKDFDGKRCKD